MEWRKTFRVLPLLLLLLVDKCAAEEEQQGCHAGNCTDGTTTTSSSVSITEVTSTTTASAKDDETEVPFIFVTPAQSSSTDTSHRSRAINFTSEERHAENELATRKTPSADLSDVNMDEEDEGDGKDDSHSGNLAAGICVKGGLTYSDGERIEDDCESVCVCTKGKMDCKPRCSTPFIKKGKTITDPLCTAKPAEDVCCSVLVCEADTETEPLEMCVHGNKTFNRGEKFENGCVEVCTCEAGGKFNCKPRCKPIEKTSDRCVPVQDPEDPCCKKVYCDVSLDDHEHHDTPKLKLMSAKYANSSTVLVKMDGKAEIGKQQVELSPDNKMWTKRPVQHGGVVDSKGIMAHFLRLEHSDDFIHIQNANCSNNGTIYAPGAEFYENCHKFCICLEGGVQCLRIQCPTYSGLDVIDPDCTEWEITPHDFIPVPPRCCPEKVRCKKNSSCIYDGTSYRNWDQIPENVTGCEKTCHCENGKIECQPTCLPVPAVPPHNLPCPGHQAILGHRPDDECCMTWMCSASPTDSDESNTPMKTDKDKDDNHAVVKKPSVPKHDNRTDSEFMGPLLIYENDKPQHNETDLQTLHVEYDGNHDVPLPPPPPPRPIPFVPMKHDSEEPPPYVGPFNPNSGSKASSPTKNKKGDKTTNNISGDKHKLNRPPPSFVPTQSPVSDGIYHVINNAPPSAQGPQSQIPGNVFEIHNYNTNAPGGRPPFLPNQIDTGFPFDQLMKHVHEGQLPPGFGGLPPHNHPAYAQFPFMHGQTPNQSQGFPGFANLPSPGTSPYQNTPDAINVQQVEAIDGRTVRLIFSVSSLIVGLHGRVEVRYTNKKDDDPDRWEVQVFAPPNDLIATQQMEFDLIGLEPATEYRLKITVMLRDLHNTPTSRVYTVRTPDTPPPVIPIDPHLVVLEANDTWANVAWRKLDNYELQYVDGVQLRYKEVTGKIYQSTPLIHRAVTSYLIENLKPATSYELGIFFIPFAGQTTELQADVKVNLTTAPKYDPYAFNVTLEIQQIKATNVDVSWSGVPYPEDKYVNIYRAIYQSESGKGDQSTFKIAKRDSPTKTTILDLKPGTRYRIWLEVYLTSGRIMTSNVLDFQTRPRPLASTGPLTDGLEERNEHTDYYGPMVVVAILAAVAVLSAAVLLAMLVRRRAQNKATISSASTVSQSAYDNPTYKVEIQQETMDL